jgi:hypothetical protein
MPKIFLKRWQKMIETILSGFFFWFIIVTNIASDRFGYQTFSDLEAEAQLQKINDNPKRFKTGFMLILIEHVGIICLALTLFFAFNSYSIILAVVWTVSRTIEALIQIFYKKSYWRLSNIAQEYSKTGNSEKTLLEDSALNILRTKNAVFTVAQILFSIGTLAYSVLFATSTGVPDIIGWFGIVAGSIYGLGSGIKLVKVNFKVMWSIGGLLILIFELVIGGWLLFSPLI